MTEDNHSPTRTRGDRVDTPSSESEDNIAVPPCPVCETALIPDGQHQWRCDECSEQYSAESFCPECAGRVVGDSSEQYCQDCGLVVDDTPDLKSQTGFKEARDNKRTGPAESEIRRARGPSTDFSAEFQDAKGRAIPAKKRDQIRRLRKRQRQFRARSSQDKDLEYAMTELSRMVSALGLVTRVRETGVILYRRALSADLLHGRSIEAMVGAALYFACRQENTPRRLSRIAAVSKVSQNSLYNAVTVLSQELGLDMEPVKPEEYISQYASELALSQDTERTARNLLSEADSRSVFSGGSPASLAASALYAASLAPSAKELNQDDVAEATDVSIRAISKTYRKLQQFRQKDD